MNWATLGGNRIVSGQILTPYYGAAAADVLLASTASVDAQTELVIGNLSMAVHVVRQASFAGSRSFRLVAGHGGWRTLVDRKWYSSPVALPLATIMSDVAAEVGERVSVPASRLISAQYSRSRGKAVRVLEQLAPDWWIAPDGVTHVGSRDASPITSPLTVERFSGSKGQLVIATEDMASWLPGRTFTSQTITDPITIGSTSITLDNSGRVRLEVLSVTDTHTDRIFDPLDEVIDARIPLAYMVPWQCTIVAVNGTGPWTVDVVPSSPQCPLPGMTALTHVPSIAGSRVKPANGGTCVVVFLDGDPQLPRVMWFDDTQSDEVDLSRTDDLLVADPTGRVLRWGDTVDLFGCPTPLVPFAPVSVSRVRA